MSQLDDVSHSDFVGGVETNTVEYKPSSIRSGLVTLRTEPFPDNSPFVKGERGIATFSVRAGRPVDFVNNTKRIKRKMVCKCRLPVATPGMIAGAPGSIVDYIDVELTVSTPVEATEDQLYSAIHFAHLTDGVFGQGWVEDMLVNGNEPY
jgi:hypothetical protein